MNAAPLLLALVLALPLFGQVPNTLRHTLVSPNAVLQSEAYLGVSVAIDQNKVVVGAPHDATGAPIAGVVKVFDATSGTLLLVIENPSPPGADVFGFSVGISGTRIIVGAYGDDTGAMDTGRAYIYDLASPTPSVPIFTLSNPFPSSLDGFGYAVAISGTRAVVGSYQDSFGGSAFVYNLAGATPTEATHILTLPGPAFSGDHFGYAVAIDGQRIVVGAESKNVGGIKCGRAYVYDLASVTPSSPVAVLPNPTPEETDRFGCAVAISGTRILVGAYGDDTADANAGAVYVFDLASATPTVPTQTLLPSTPSGGDCFGFSVALAGTRAIVGAWVDDDPFVNIGRAFAYDLAGATPMVPIAVLENPSPVAGDCFGYSAAITGGLVVVGAPFADPGATDAGRVWTFNLDSATPGTPIASMSDPGIVPGDFFGAALVLSGTKVIVGSPNEDAGNTDVGRVFVYDLASGDPRSPMLVLDNPNLSSYDQFGFRLAAAGTKVIVGAGFDDAGGTQDVGSAYVYDLASATPNVPILTLSNPSPGAADRFGFAVAASGSRVVIGADGDDAPGAPSAGQAYVYDLTSATPDVPVVTLPNPSPTNSDFFGTSVAISGMWVVVGAFWDDAGATDTGTAYVYNLAGATPDVPVLTLNNPSPAADDRFAYAVAISGSRVAVGAIQDDTGASNAGIVYVYDLAGATPTVPVWTLTNPAPASADNFGATLAFSGARLVVGAFLDDAGAIDAGRAYVYDLGGGTPSVPVATLSNPTPGMNDNFASSVAINGLTIAIGAMRDNTSAPDGGAAYIFRPANNDADGDGLLDLWEEARFGTTAGHDADDDTDGDGRIELLELAFDRDPLVPDAAGPAVTAEDGYLTLTIAKRAGVTYLGQSAGTLDAFSAATTTVLTNNATTLKVRDNFPIVGGAQRFLQMKVTAAP